MSFSPYLGFPGTAREAMTAYAAIFGASDLQIMSGADAPADQRSPGPADHVMHAQFSAGPGAPLMGADMPEEGMSGRTSTGSVFHAAPTRERAEAIFAALSEGANVFMPMQATFWSPAFGMLTDRWGTTWMISVAE